MYYEFYIDVFFVVNLVMDFLLLRLVNRVLKGTATPLRSLAGAALGAAGICVITLLPLSSSYVRVLLSHGFLGVLMVWVGCRCRSWRKLVTGLLLLYGFSFLTGGILTALPVSTKEGLLTFCFITTATYWILILGMRLLEYLKGKSSAICEVVIRAGGKSVKVKGLYDTGNRLRDTLTRKPVSVVEYGKFEELLGEDQKASFERLLDGNGSTEDICARSVLAFHPHYISYRSVGQDNGLMLAVTVDELYVSAGEEGSVVKHAVLGLAGNQLSTAGNFQIIVNPCIVSAEP